LDSSWRVSQRMIRRVVIGFGLLAGAMVLAVAAWSLSVSRTIQLVGDVVTYVPVSDSLVALTFDDGPVPAQTDSVLAQLDESGIKATFFMLGRSMAAYPELAARVRARGHEIGNHSYSHRRMLLMAPGTIRREIETTDSLIRAVGQTGPIYMRPPYGQRLIGLPMYLSKHHRPIILWDIAPDGRHADAEAIVRYAEAHTRPGSIVLMHVEAPSARQSRRALPALITTLQEKGYRFVTLSELLQASTRTEARVR
jgi:peptidoglycan/xylan/chitin deacetylase (PgdA/CDA1 family)